jgi:hypothetical protein
MSEYLHVEKPFLDQLAALGWKVTDQGQGFIPSVPTQSLRMSFREWFLPQVFREAVRSINLTPSGKPWLTDRQLDDLRDQILRQPNRTLLEANETFRDFYVAKGLERLGNRVAYDAPKVGVEPAGVEVKEIGLRWASCSPGGKLSFHWKCMMAPQTIKRADVEFERLEMRFQSLWGRSLQLIDCQNVFCEVSKYARVAHPDVAGESGRTRIKQKYAPRPAPIPQWYPPKWGLKIDSVASVSMGAVVPKRRPGKPTSEEPVRT